MIPIIIYNVTNGFEKVWENPMHSEYDLTNGPQRVYIKTDTDEEWHIIAIDENLDKYWNLTLFEGANRADKIINLPYCPEPITFDEYMKTFAFIGIIEDTFQLPFINETKELSELLHSGKFTWNVSPDVSIWNDEGGMGLGFDT